MAIYRRGVGDVRRRVRALERLLKVDGGRWCECQRAPRVEVVWDDGSEVLPFAGEREPGRAQRSELAPEQPEICPRCGREVRRVLVNLVWDDDELEG